MLSERVHDQGLLTVVYVWDITLLNTQQDILIFRFYYACVFSTCHVVQLQSSSLESCEN